MGLRRSEAGVAKLNAIYWGARYHKPKETTTMTNATPFPRREVVQFPLNEPITLALKYAQPKICMRPGGDDFAMFTTTDNRVMFLDPEVARQITDLGVKPGEEFRMEMQWTGRRGDPKIYHAWQDEPLPEEEPESDLEAKLRKAIETVKTKKAGPAVSALAPPAAPQSHQENSALQQLQGSNPWAARVREQTQVKLALYSELCCWAKENLPGVTRNEVRAILMNVMISSERGQAR